MGKLKRVTSTLAKASVFKQCVGTMEEIEELSKKTSYFDHIKFVKSFCFFRDRCNASSGSKAAVTARTRLGWKTFLNVGSCLTRERFH